MRSAVARTTALLLALAAGACSTTDYSYARQTRGDRPYRGGAADVPERRPEPQTDSIADAINVVGYFGYWVLAWTQGH